MEEVVKVVEHCVPHCKLMMVCGKSKTTKVGMVKFNIVNESMNELMKEVGIEQLGQLKIKNAISDGCCTLVL